MKRSYACGSQKRKKRKEEDDKKKQDSGALLKFLSPQALPKDTSTDEGTPSTSSSIHDEEADTGFYGALLSS
ncbi:hypothetical protein AALO_G00030450 [Alosa alosa]|uniref:Uncharacterized protein n=1 Tax=Alosa alosa TaxID=278164 RepID=A0AAV6HH10_9TELE|nr:hypothetical protein AALO_G00030450 [Alosa alosa]